MNVIQIKSEYYLVRKMHNWSLGIRKKNCINYHFTLTYAKVIRVVLLDSLDVQNDLQVKILSLWLADALNCPPALTTVL